MKRRSRRARLRERKKDVIQKRIKNKESNFYKTTEGLNVAKSTPMETTLLSQSTQQSQNVSNNILSFNEDTTALARRQQIPTVAFMISATLIATILGVGVCSFRKRIRKDRVKRKKLDSTEVLAKWEIKGTEEYASMLNEESIAKGNVRNSTVQQRFSSEQLSINEAEHAEFIRDIGSDMEDDVFEENDKENKVNRSQVANFSRRKASNSKSCIKL